MVHAGPNVEVSKFGGEGTGIKTMKAFSWKENDTITFQVKSEMIENDWFCTCEFTNNGGTHLMATLKRNVDGGNLLNRTGFYSFIEDWDRCKKAKGYRVLRKAEYLKPKLDQITLTSALFTKVCCNASLVLK